MQRILGVILLTTGCGASVVSASASPRALDPTMPKVTAEETFNRALASFTSHETAGDWTASSCNDVAQMFDQTPLPVAAFDAGLALQRCSDDAGALARFKQALLRDPKLHAARVQVTLYEYKADGDIAKAIRTLEQSVIDASFQDASALAALAALQMQRAAGNDMETARTNLGRALAINDNYMPALNQLALYYTKAGHLDVAALVASQAMEKNGSYAPIFNTAGLVQNKLHKPSLAAQFFQQATKLDPTFFEAHMNLGELNLSFRGFKTAEAAFRQAITLHPNDYDAHLGLALALRGQITGEVVDPAKIAPVRVELATCKKIDARRPEAYFNEGILTQEFETKAGADPRPVLDRAIATFGEFKVHAAGKVGFEAALEKADQRIDDAKVEKDFFIK